MPSEQPPQGPKPPEYEHEPSTRAILIAMLGIYARQIMGREIKNEASRIFPRAPIEHVQEVWPPRKQTTDDKSRGADEDDIDDPDLAWLERQYQIARRKLGIDDDHDLMNLQRQYAAVHRALDADLEKKDTSVLNEYGAFNTIRKNLGKGLKQDACASAIAIHYNALRDRAHKRGIAEIFGGITLPLMDPGFAKRFGYDSAVVGLHHQVLALLPSSGSGRQHVLFGMTVSYTKKLEPSGQTGPLSGTGKIAAFLIPPRAGDTIPDQVVLLTVPAEAGTTKTLLSLDEISLER